MPRIPQQPVPLYPGCLFYYCLHCFNYFGVRFP